MATNSNHPDGLTIRQRRALAALLTGRSVKAAAIEAKVGERTLHTWLNDSPAFRQALAQAEGERMSDAGRALLDGQAEVIERLVELIRNAQSESVKRAAIRDWLEFAFRYREATTTEQRLSDLEALINGNGRKAT